LAQTLDAVLDRGDLTGFALDAGLASHSHFTALPGFLRLYAGGVSRMGTDRSARPITQDHDSATESHRPRLSSAIKAEAGLMDIAAFHAARRFADVNSGRIVYFQQGSGPPALFIHGVPLNGYHWRHIIDRVKHRRRCVALDLMALGYTEIAVDQDVCFAAQARMIAEVMDALAIDRADLIANDSGGAIAQIFAAHYPDRLNSLVLTNWDVHDGWPPPQVLPLIEAARNATLAPIFQPLVDRPALARERHARGELVPLFRCYADPSVLKDEIIRVYLQSLLASPRRIEAFEQYWLGFDNTQTVNIHGALKALQIPTLIVWDWRMSFFDRKWAHWLKATIPGARRVIEIEDGRLFFPEDRPEALARPLLRFWDEMA
jgi:pimeloyl-ACP methyl ester carboxylesterase